MTTTPAPTLVTVASPLVIGHRGAPGYLPEHTLASYRLAVALGADAVEPDLVMTRDGVLVIRHESELSRTTDVAAHPEFADRVTTRSVAGRRTTGWFVEDFSLDELQTLRVVERWPDLRPQSARHDGRFPVATFDQLLLLVAEQSAVTGRRIGVHAELKHPAGSAALGLALEPAVLASLRDHGLDRRDAPVHLQSFEPTCLRRLREDTDVRLVQLLAGEGAPADLRASGDPTSYDDMAARQGLRTIARYADAVGVDKRRLLTVRPDAPGPAHLDGRCLVDAAHRAGLTVLTYTVRNENRFLTAAYLEGSQPGAVGDVVGETRSLMELGVDGIFTDQPDTTVLVRALAPLTADAR